MAAALLLACTLSTAFGSASAESSHWPIREVKIAKNATSVALSANGRIGVIGDSAYSEGEGAVWIIKRSHGTWTPQGAPALRSQFEDWKGGFGSSVALSANADTILVGEPAEWGWGSFFTRAGSTWLPQAGFENPAGHQSTGFARNLALSSNGETALIANVPDGLFGPFEGAHITGDVWAFTREGPTWALLPPALRRGSEEPEPSVALDGDGDTAVIGTGGSLEILTRQGSSWMPASAKFAPGEEPVSSRVAISSNGRIIVVADPNAGSNSGAAWVLERHHSTWIQQGPKLTATEVLSGDQFGLSLAVSADGRTVLIGSAGEAAWVFERPGWSSTWTQQGPKLTCEEEGCEEGSKFGESVALSASGATALISVFQRPVVTSVSPDNGPAAGGTTITITGKHLGEVSRVEIGGVSVPFTITSDTSIVAVSPSKWETPRHEQSADVYVIGPAEGSSPLGFRYWPWIEAVSPDEGPSAGGFPVTITGVGFSKATVVTFGNDEAKFKVNSDNSITAIAPPHTTGFPTWEEVKVTTTEDTSDEGTYFEYLTSPAP